MTGTVEGEELIMQSGFRVSDIDQEEIIYKDCCRVVSVPQSNTTNITSFLKTYHQIISIINA